MQLPNRDQAHIDRRKLTDYLLNRNHPEAKGKSAFFRGRYGTDWQALRDGLRAHATHPVTTASETRHGTMYVIEHDLIEHDLQDAPVRSVWMIRTGESFPRLVTAYPIG